MQDSNESEFGTCYRVFFRDRAKFTLITNKFVVSDVSKYPIQNEIIMQSCSNLRGCELAYIRSLPRIYLNHSFDFSCGDHAHSSSRSSSSGLNPCTMDCTFDWLCAGGGV